METSDSDILLNDAFETSLWLKLEEAKRARERDEIAIDYNIVSGRVKNLRDDYLEGETLISTRASEGMKFCTKLSDGLQKSNEMGTDLLTGLEELIEDLLFRLETIHHSGAQDESEDEEDIEPFNEESANTEITAILSERAKVKTIVEHNIISCNAKLSTIKNEISELVNSNPRNRRMSRHFKTLNFGALSGGGARDSRRSIFKTVEEDPEQFDPDSMDVNFTIKEIYRFINDQELPSEEANPAIAKVKALHKFLDYLKRELKTANQRATDEQIKSNSLQNRIPKLEESRVKLSQQMESLKDTVRDKDTTIAKLNMKIKSMENMADKPSAATLPKDRQESNASVKQAVVPKSVLREILQASEKEVEEKLKVLAASNEAIRVVLVRKNKQIRQLEGTIIQLNAEAGSYKSKIEMLEESILSGTADADAIREEREEEEDICQDPDLEPPPHGSPALQSSLDESVYLDSDGMTTPGPHDVDERIMIDGSTNTDIEVEEAFTQTNEDEEQIIIPDMGNFRINRNRRGTRRASIAKMAAEDGIRKAARRASTVSSAQRKGSMAQKDLFGIGAGKHSPTKSDLATVHEFQRQNDLNDKTVKQVEDISVLQKYIASMREQTEKSMEKIREFIAKEKARNDAKTRRLINEHEKFLSNHKKEFNKVFYSIQRFKEMMVEILNGKDITQIVPQTTFKTELSPIQLRIQSTETLSSLEFDVFQAIKQKDMKIRDLSGRKRLDDKHLDRRIKEREKAVFSILDHMNEKLKKEKEVVSKKEKWVNEKIKIELEYEKAQENEVHSIEKALVKFWKEHPELVGALGTLQSSGSEVRPPSPTPSASPRITNGTVVIPTTQQQKQQQQQLQQQQHQQQQQQQSEQQITEQGQLMEQSFVPRLYIRVSDQRNNLLRFDMAHRAGTISNLAHKLISNIIDRWLELIEQKTSRIFRAYIKYRRFSDLQAEVMNNPEDDCSHDMNRSMTLHRRITNAMDLQHKKLHLELGKLSTYCENLLEEEQYFFDKLSDGKLLKLVVRPAFHQINCNVMFKKLLEVAQEKRTVQVTMPHVVESCSSNKANSPENLEDIPVLKQVANDKVAGSWNTDYKKESEAKSLLVPRILQLDTDKMYPLRMIINQPSQIRPYRSSSARRRCVTGLPPIPHSERISYIPTIASVWSSRESVNSSEQLK